MTATETYDDRGIRFDYPAGWELEVNDDGETTTVALQCDDGPAFAIITLDDSRPDPVEVAEEALEALREEYPGLEVGPPAPRETLGGFRAVGHDAEFFSLDMVAACAIRCCRTPRRTILVFGQWATPGDGDDPGDQLRALCRSLAETDAVLDN